MNFSLGNALAFAPEWWLLLGAVAAFALGRIRPAAEDETSVIGLLAVLAALLALLTQLRSNLVIFDSAYVVDGYTRMLQGIVLAAAAACLLLTLSDRTWTPAPDFAGFLLLASTAAVLIAGAADLVSLTLGVLLLGACLSVMVVAARPAIAPAAGAGAFIATSLAAALVAYGFALLYGLTGETGLDAIGRGLGHQASRPVLTVAVTLAIAGFGVLIGVVPVHWGQESIFERAPLPVGAFIGSVALPAALGALTRVLGALAAAPGSIVTPLLAVLAGVTMTGATLGALGERSLRRLLALLVMGQAGFGLAAVVGLRQGGVAALLILLGSLAAGLLAAVAALIAFTRLVHSDRIADLSGMAGYAPGAAAVLSLALASLSGAPPLAGFFGRLVALQAAVDSGYAWLALLGVANTVVTIVIALRLLRTVFFDPPVFEVHPVRPHPAQGVALTVTTLAVVAFGAFLGPLYGFAAAGARAVLP